MTFLMASGVDSSNSDITHSLRQLTRSAAHQTHGHRHLFYMFSGTYETVDGEQLREWLDDFEGTIHVADFGLSQVVNLLFSSKNTMHELLHVVLQRHLLHFLGEVNVLWYHWPVTLAPTPRFF